MSIFSHHWFSYGITRPVTLRWFNIVVLIVGIIYIVFITLINVVAVGYEYVSVIDHNYNDTSVNWYEHFLPKNGGWAVTRKCNGTSIKVKDGKLFSLPTHR
jgi:hypothetical protein